MGLPQFWLSDEVRAGMARLGATARERGVSIAIHTHVNAAQSVTPLVARAARAMLDTGIRDVLPRCYPWVPSLEPEPGQGEERDDEGRAGVWRSPLRAEDR